MGKFWDMMCSPMLCGADEIEAYWEGIAKRDAAKNPPQIIHKHVHLYGSSQNDEIEHKAKNWEDDEY